MSKEWYYSDSGNQAGPVTEQELKQKVLAGTVKRDTPVWSEGMADWSDAEKNIPGLFNTSPLKVADAYRASTVSQPALRGEVYSMSPSQVLFSFNGRIRRSTFWGYSIAGAALYIGIIAGAMAIFGEESDISFIIIAVFFIPFIWTNLAIRVKRWHDRGKSGFWVFINAIPYVGELWALIENGCLEGDHGPNEYGPDPKH